MGCACSIDLDYLDYDECAEYARITKPKARRQHKCQECKEKIQIGEAYERVEAVYSGKWETSKTCNSCLEIRNCLFCGSYTFGAIWDDIYNEIMEYDIPLCILNQLSIPARNKLIEFIDRQF